MFSDHDSLVTVVETAKSRDLKPLLEECAEELDLDSEQVRQIHLSLNEAWFFGVKLGHRVILETKPGEKRDPMPVIASMQDEFQDVMERCAEGLNLTIGATIAAWNYLGTAWIAGAKFWELELTAQLIEDQLGGFDEVLRRLGR